ncbi:MAG: flagellar biosynthetic protein FliR [Blastocatellia bacterium]
MENFLSFLSAMLNLLEVRQSPQAFLVLVGLAFARFIAFLQLVPFFGGQSVPGRVKVATATAFVIVAYPSLTPLLPPPGTPLPIGPLGFITLMVKEVLVGFALGFVATLIFEAIQMAGRLIDIQRGSNLSELFAPQIQDQVSELGQFKLQFAIVLFLAIGAHRLFIGALIDSFVLVPPLGFPPLVSGWSPLAEFFVTFFGKMMMITLQLAAPALIALLMTEIFFGLINRVAPQINVFFLSMPVKVYLGMVVVFLALFQLQSQFINLFGESFKAFEYLLNGLSRKL